MQCRSAQLVVKITSTTPSMTVANIYRPPQSSLVNFYEELADLLAVIASHTDRLLVVGDFNCPGDGPASIGVELSSVFESLSLLQHVCEPTRLGSLLDLVIIDHELTISKLSVNDAGLVSDHRLVTATVCVRRAGFTLRGALRHDVVGGPLHFFPT